jgi:EAL domain-containing protein (putative c-di-GMP-specific phosphodiesterase class I)
MPEVERTELLGPITRWMIDQALRQQARWRDDGVDRTIAVNIASRSLGPDSALPDLIAELTQAALDLLIAYGCDSAQGDLLGSRGGVAELTAPQPDSRHAGAVASPYV